MINLLGAVNKILALGTIGSQIFIVLAIAYAFLPYKKQYISDFFVKNGIKLAFIVALILFRIQLLLKNKLGKYES